MAEQSFEYPVFYDSLDDIAPPCVTPFLIGHTQPRHYLLEAARAGHHALILDGEQGIGKSTAAFQLANAFLSNSLVDAVPDIGSSTYRQIAQNVHPNLMNLTRPLNADGKSFKTVITIEEVRRLQRFLGMTSSNGDRRVIIIDSVGDMNRNAANAVLKFLEEPPANTLFLLISHGIGGLLPTIRSRCQLVRFAPLSEPEVSQVLNKVAATVLNPSEISQLAAIAGGSVRQALLMARNGGLELRESLDLFLNSSKFDTEQVHRLAEVAATRGSDIHNLLLRNMLLDSLRQRALGAISSGDLHYADRIAQMDAEISERARIADGYNLDKKQEFLVVADKVHALLHAQ